MNFPVAIVIIVTAKDELYLFWNLPFVRIGHSMTIFIPSESVVCYKQKGGLLW